MTKVKKILILSMCGVGVLTAIRYNHLRAKCIEKQLEYFNSQVDLFRTAYDLEKITWLRRASAISDLEQKRLIRHFLKLYDPAEIYIRLSD